MKLGFIGAGEMGGAIIRGLLKTGFMPAEIIVSVRTAASAQRLANTLGIAAYTDNKRVIVEAQRLFLAVKPAQMPEILTEIAQTGVAAKPLISMALGWSVEKIQQFLPAWPVIRIMPNTPLALGQGVTLFHFAKETPDRDRRELMGMFEGMGKAVEISLSLFDVATALSGSGPAFVYAFIDALANGAVKQGMDEKQSVLLAVQTVIGAAQMVLHEGISPAQLARNVATPGGCTAAGMEVLQQSNFHQILIDTLAATAARAREVGKN